MDRPLDAVLAVHKGGPVRVGRFLARAQALAGRLGRAGALINLCHDRHLFSLAFAGGLLGGRTTLLPANRLPATIDVLTQQYPDSLIISDQPIEGLPHPVLDPSSMLAINRDADSMPEVPSDLLAAMVFTSGSTGPSSSIRKPWRTLYHSSRINAAEYGPREPGTRVVATVPAQHMWGLETSVLLPWFGPVAVVSGQPFFAPDILSALESVPRPRALISTPVHLRALVESGLELVEVDRIYSATAPLPAALAAELERRTGARLVEVFGCSEAGCLARRRAARDEPWRLFEAFSLARRDGRFVACAEHLPEPVPLLDHLVMEADGRFRLAGRHSDLVNIAGKRASLADLTQALLEINGVIDGVIFLPPETDPHRVNRLAALVVAPNLSTAALRQALARRIDPVFMPRPLRQVDALPRAESGKLPRQALIDFLRTVGASTE
jgi:acyl-coenzyme A synthetase/AMP-(fatty) acid ligase